MDNIWTIIVDYLPDVERFKFGLINKNIYNHTRRDIKDNIKYLLSVSRLPQNMLIKFKDQIDWKVYLSTNPKLEMNIFKECFNQIYQQIMNDVVNFKGDKTIRLFNTLQWTLLLIEPKYSISYLKKVNEDKKIDSNKVEVLIDLIKDNRYLTIGKHKE